MKIGVSFKLKEHGNLSLNSRIENLEGVRKGRGPHDFPES